MTDDLYAGFRRGDRDVFRRLVEELSPRLLGVALGYTEDRDTAHDMVQEVWMRAYQRRRQLSSGESLHGWLFTICHRTCMSQRRAAGTRRHGVQRCSQDVPRPAAERPDDAAARGELRRHLTQAIAELPPRQRDVVILRLVEGATTRETARRLRCAEGTVKATLHQAKKALTPILRSVADDDVS